ncbi:MAG: VanZ family protein [Anaerohalosphaera sp.]|nr:VanZ family protein [Anaerohalosphaera sp.]
MKIERTHKYILTALLVYWPAMFIVTHMKVPAFVGKMKMSDDVMHFVAYMVLAVLAWIAVSDGKKVDWKQAKVWYLLAVIVCYGALDEWLQGFVNRQPQVSDFIADLCGAVAALVVLSIFSFWIAVLVVTTVVIFCMTNLSHGTLICGNELINTAFYFLSYTFITLVWVQYVSHLAFPERDKRLWYAATLAVPLGLLAVINGISPLFSSSFSYFECATSLSGILAAVLVSDIITRMTCKRNIQKADQLH